MAFPGSRPDERDQGGGRAKDYRRLDEHIRAEVCTLLSDDPRIDASNIDVSVGTGEVTLSGNVLTREEKRLAEDLAERVSDVLGVQNCLTVAAARLHHRRDAP